MSGLSRILGAAEAFKAPSVVVVARLCTHRHHQASSCSRCVDVCPAQAMTVSAEGASVDTLSCADCGACVSACPTGALAAVRPTDKRLVSRSRPRPAGGRMMLACVGCCGRSRRGGGGLPRATRPSWSSRRSRGRHASRCVPEPARRVRSRRRRPVATVAADARRILERSACRDCRDRGAAGPLPGRRGPDSEPAIAGALPDAEASDRRPSREGGSSASFVMAGPALRRLPRGC